MERIDILKAAFGDHAQNFEDNIVADSKAQFDACKDSLLPHDLRSSLSASVHPPSRAVGCSP